MARLELLVETTWNHSRGRYLFRIHTYPHTGLLAYSQHTHLQLKKFDCAHTGGWDHVIVSVWYNVASR